MALEADETYISVEDAEEYAELMELELPEGEELEVLLRKAAIYLDRLWGARYLGNRSVGTQLLYWPRAVLSYYDSAGNYRSDFTIDAIPTEVGQAQVELAALIYADIDVLKQPVPVVTSSTVKVDVISKSVTYLHPYAANPLWGIELLLFPVLQLSGQTSSHHITMDRGR